VISRFARRYGSRPWFIAIARSLVPLDRFLGRLTRGRFVALSMREIPSLMITTTGRKSGLPRSNPLVYAPDGDAFVVIGSNWGQAHHPAWSGNLLANPDATVTLKGVDIPVRARLVTGGERPRLEAKLRTIYPGYADYERTAGGRHLRIFRLERV
jgi:deazaflavin-dependent oxidoreductase (nitroreductase family)